MGSLQPPKKPGDVQVVVVEDVVLIGAVGVGVGIAVMVGLAEVVDVLS